VLKTVITDGYGSDNKAKVNGEGELTVVVHPHPPKDEAETPLPFRQYFTADGSSSGSNDMVVDGSSTPQRFYIAASQDFDIYIKSMSVRISDAGATLDKFGALTALSNGLEFSWFNKDEGEYILHDGIKTNLEFVRLAGGQPSFGTGADAFKADLQGGGSDDSYLPILNMTDVFGMPWGIRLRKGSSDKVSFVVKDALAGISVFNIIGYGLGF